jgi:hypothetical protein
MIKESMMKQVPQMLCDAGQALAKPAGSGALMAAGGLAAGRSLLGRAVLPNPLALLALGAVGGIAAGFLLFKYQKEITEGLGKLGGMGKDFALNRKENLNDLMAEAEEKLSGVQPPATAPGDVERT